MCKSKMNSMQTYFYSTKATGTLEDSHQTGQQDTTTILPFQNMIHNQDPPSPVKNLTRYKLETQKRWEKGSCTRGISKKGLSKKNSLKPGQQLLKLLKLQLQGMYQQKTRPSTSKESSQAYPAPTRARRRKYSQKKRYKKYTSSWESSSEPSDTESASESDF
ncbi:ORF3 [Anelloviridae sp.]|nr:ORF3 [Anelloviridae sp.]